MRHNDISLLEQMVEATSIPIINAMTSQNHPCEILTDLYSLSKIRQDYLKDNYLFVGEKGNIGNTWKEAAELFGFSFLQCCPKGSEITGAKVCYNFEEAITGKDVRNVIIKRSSRDK